MNVWLIHLGELLPVDDNPRLFRYGILAEMLAARGHDVTRWAPTFVHGVGKQRADADTVVDLAPNHRLRLLYAPGYHRHVGLARIRFHKRIARSFALHAPSVAAPDIIVVGMPTPEMCARAVEYGRARGVPVVIDVRDLWPDIYLDLLPSSLRWLGNLAIRPLRAKNRRTFRKAAAITAIAPSYLRWGLANAGREAKAEDRVFHMGYRKQSLADDDLETVSRKWRERGVEPEAFVCCFFGTMGRQYDLETVLAAAASYGQTDGQDVRFVLCGGGVNFQRYKAKADGLANVLMPGWVGADDITAIMGAASAGLAPYAAGARMSLPNKPFEYFSGGLPVLSSLTGELERILSAGDCGLTYLAGDVDGLVECIETLRRDPDKRIRMGRNAHAQYEANFSADAVYSSMIDHLAELALKHSAC